MGRDRVRGGPTIPHKVVIRILNEQVRDLGQGMALTLAKRLAGRVRQTIIGQTEHWPPLSQRYAAAKARRGLDPRMLIATGRYVNSIRARKSGTKTYVVAPSRESVLDAHGIPTDLTLRDLGAIHEFGSRKRSIPPRPHWRPVWQHFLRQQDEIKAEIRRKLRSSVQLALKGHPVPKELGEGGDEEGDVPRGPRMPKRRTLVLKKRIK